MIQQLPKIRFADTGRFFLIAGPCAIENDYTPFKIAEYMTLLTERLGIPYIFKGSYRKANRSRLDSFTGIGDEAALKIIREIGEQFGVPTTTDIHETAEAAMAAEYVDVLQIPAFLVRQTNLVVAAAETGKAVTLKKAQFLSPESMQFPVQKVTASGNNQVAIIERGSQFGYQDLVVDMRGIPVMQQYAPVILDVTHSLQQPNQASGVTGGRPALISTIARAGIAAGANGLFIETHTNPSEALSDGANMLALDQMENLLESLIRVHDAVRE
ncbi:MAG: 3-deoxy-8-phosphooctulonate synthase [Weeksellaceae bacterium]|nr:3-deoxy-8-phosphooctulonate synthase [Weeksellaceae bacterium]